MIAIAGSRVSQCADGAWEAACGCGKTCRYASKAGALRMLARGSCRHCSRHYSHVRAAVPVYQNADGKWCSTCSGCGKEQPYTRMDHAKQSELGDWQCRSCVARAKGLAGNRQTPLERQVFNKFQKMAANRGLPFSISFDVFVGAFTGKCALTGGEISIGLKAGSASLDRIDSSKGYEAGNVQWVHPMVNICKNKYAQEVFLDMCRSVALSHREKW